MEEAKKKQGGRRFYTKISETSSHEIVGRLAIRGNYQQKTKEWIK